MNISGKIRGGTGRRSGSRNFANTTKHGAMEGTKKASLLGEAFLLEYSGIISP